MNYVESKQQDRWVLVNKLAQETGYTEDAVRTKIKRKVWVYGAHWRKAPDDRVVLNLSEIQRWMAGKSR